MRRDRANRGIVSVCENNEIEKEIEKEKSGREKGERNQRKCRGRRRRFEN